MPNREEDEFDRFQRQIEEEQTARPAPFIERFSPASGAPQDDEFTRFQNMPPAAICCAAELVGAAARYAHRTRYPLEGLWRHRRQEQACRPEMLSHVIIHSLQRRSTSPFLKVYARRPVLLLRARLWGRLQTDSWRRWRRSQARRARVRIYAEELFDSYRHSYGPSARAFAFLGAICLPCVQARLSIRQGWDRHRTRLI